MAAELQGKADTLFKGESLRACLLNAYGWWTVATIALWAGIAMLVRCRTRAPLDPRVQAADKVSVMHTEEATAPTSPEYADRNTLERAAFAPGRFTGGARLQAGSFLSPFLSVGQQLEAIRAAILTV